MNQSFADLCADAKQNPPDVAVVLGSGFSDIAQKSHVLYQIPYANIPDMPAASVAGHKSQLLLGRLAEKNVLFFQGRFHRYEGHDWDAVLRPVRIAHELGARKLLVTNAAGGIRDDLLPGSLMALTGIIEVTEQKAWRHEKPNEHIFNEELTTQLCEAASELSILLPVGVYAQVLGPCYETPAEIRALRTWGADAVGMSTGCELRFAYTLGIKCAALSLITNRAAGLSEAPLSHDEVLETALQRNTTLVDLLENFVSHVA